MNPECGPETSSRKSLENALRQLSPQAAATANPNARRRKGRTLGSQLAFLEARHYDQRWVPNRARKMATLLVPLCFEGLFLRPESGPKKRAKDPPPELQGAHTRGGKKGTKEKRSCKEELRNQRQLNSSETHVNFPTSLQVEHRCGTQLKTKKTPRNCEGSPWQATF